MFKSGACFIQSVKAFFAKLLNKEQPKCSVVRTLELAVTETERLEKDVAESLLRIKDLEEAAKNMVIANQQACADAEEVEISDDCSDINVYKKALEAEKFDKCKIVRETGAYIKKLKEEHSAEIKSLEKIITDINARHKTELAKLATDSGNAILNAEKRGAQKERERNEATVGQNANVKETIMASKALSEKKKTEKKEAAVVTTNNGETIVRNNGKRAFSDDQVRSIRKQVNDDKIQASTIARDYGVSASTINRIANGSSYANVK